MRIRPIPDGDGLFRHAVYPHHFTKTSSTGGAVFAIKSLMRIKEDESDGLFHTSLGWERYLPNSRHVHAIGCRNAFRQNARLKAKGKYKEKDRRIYCGAYRSTARAIRELPLGQALSGVSSVEVTHLPEEGEIAHVDLKFALSSDFDTETTKTAIIRLLWSACCGPLKHACHCDKDLDFHPNAHLAVPPGGEYSDARLWWLRSFYVLRFYALCLWDG